MSDERIALLFAAMLAISPCLIFYSRNSRAYSLMMLLCFWALLLSFQWLTTGKRRYAIGLVLAGSFAVYALLLSAVTLAVAFGVAVIGRPFKSLSRNLAIPLSGKQFLAVAFVMLVLPLLAQWPNLVHWSNFSSGPGRITIDSFVGAATLLSGTANIPLNVIFYLLCCAGQVLLINQKPLLGSVFLAVICAHMMLILVTQPDEIDTPLVVLRYMIVAVPISFVLIAVAADSLYSRMQKRFLAKGIGRKVFLLLSAVFVLSLLLAGPIPRTYVAPNNFTNHSAFQETYEHNVWDQSYVNRTYQNVSLTPDHMPHFYHWLGGQSDIQAIVEYPLDICDFNNRLYFYQHFHKKSVMAGYCGDPRYLGYSIDSTDDSKESFILGMQSCDDILSHVPCPEKVHLRNVVDISDRAAMSACHADIVVLHKYVVALKIFPDRTESVKVYYHTVPHFARRFQLTYGDPVYEDPHIICFRLTGAEASVECFL